MILHTEVQGDGEAVVFLHSGLQTGDTDFVHQKDVLKKERKTIAPDLRGHGKSASDDFSNYFQETAEDLKETMDHLQVHSFHLIGCSLGALVAIVYAKKYSSSLLSLTLSGVTADKPENWKDLHEAEVAMQQQLLNNHEMDTAMSGLHRSDWKQLIHMARDENWYPFDYTSDLKGIDCPILVLMGEGNEKEVASASKYKQMHDNVHVGIIPFGGHLIHVEQPVLYSEMVRAFVK